MIQFISKEEYNKIQYNEYEEAKEYAEELTRTTGIDMVKYIDVIKEVDKDIIKNIYHDLLEGIEVEKYIGTSSMWNVREELLTEKYKQVGYNDKQIQKILYFTMLEKIYLTPYITPEFTPGQIEQVAYGVQEEFDVTQYNDAKKYTANEMFFIRQDLWREKRNS